MPRSHTDPLVSVIIAAYQAGPYLAEAIDSALAQTYPALQVIVVDDASPNRQAQAIAARYGDRIQFLARAVNGGVAAARNTGLAAASGDLIAWLDQDDRWLPQKLATQVAALQAHPQAALVHSSFYHIDAAGRRTGVVRVRPGLWAPLPRLLLAMPISPCTVLFPRALLAATGPLDPALNGADDWYWALQLALAGRRFYALAAPLAEYRLHGANTVRKPDAMLPAWLGMLDRVYARPDLPAAVRRVRPRAYYERHATAAALYYGLGRTEAAAAQVRAAARVAPARVAGGRFLQSLIGSDPQGPSRATAAAAIHFVQESLREQPLPRGWGRRWRARARLVLALQRGGGVRRRLAAALRGLRGDPALLADRTLWTAARRRLSRAAARQAAYWASVLTGGIH